MKLGNLKERKNGILPEVPLEFPEVEDGIKPKDIGSGIAVKRWHTYKCVKRVLRNVSISSTDMSTPQQGDCYPLPCWKILYTSIPGNICFPEWNNCVFGGYCTYCKTETKNIHYEKKVRDFYGNNQQ